MNYKIENINFQINEKFNTTAKKYYNPGMGTENMSFILFSLIKFTRPKTILEFGAGLSTFFILNALKSNIKDYNIDRKIINKDDHNGASVNLYKNWYIEKYKPIFHIVDNFSKESPNYKKFIKDINDNNYNDLIKLHNISLIDFSKNIDNYVKNKLDIFWFDAKLINYGALEGIRDYWSKMSDNGMIIIHFTHGIYKNIKWFSLDEDYIKNIIKLDSFELIHINEPHKFRQCSFTIIKKSIKNVNYVDLKLLNNFKINKIYYNNEGKGLELIEKMIIDKKDKNEIYDTLLNINLNNPESLLLKIKISHFVIKKFYQDNKKLELCKNLLEYIINKLGLLNCNHIVLTNYCVTLRLLDYYDNIEIYFYRLLQILPGNLLEIKRRIVNKFGGILESKHKKNEARNLYKKYVDEKLFPSIYYRPDIIKIPIISIKPFEDPNIISYKSILENNYTIFKEELLNVIDKNIGSWDCLRLTDELNKWKAIRIGKQWIENRKMFPKTIKLLKEIDEKYNLNLRRENDSIKFSILNPNTHITPHCGDSNDRLRLHLGLIIPDGCYIRCKTEIRKWEEGKILLLDDTFEHEVWNWSKKKRAILIIDTWKPQITEQQKIIINQS